MKKRLRKTGTANETPAGPPMRVREWVRKIKPLKGRRLVQSVRLAVARIDLPGARRGRVKYQVGRTRTGVEVRLVTNVVGVHGFPPTMGAVRVERTKRSAISDDRLTGFLPEFLPRTPLPRPLSRELRRRRFVDSRRRTGRGRGETTSVFSPDERYTFSDTSFPWCTCGLVETGGGNGSGVWTGPRHLMT